MPLNSMESKNKNKGSALTSLKETEQLFFNIIMKPYHFDGSRPELNINWEQNRSRTYTQLNNS